LSTFDARTNHKQTRTHKTHHGPDLGKKSPSPLWYTLWLSMRPTSKWHFVLGLPSGSLEIPKVGTPWFWGPIILCVDLRWRWGLKQSCSPYQEFSNNMWHATCTQGNQGDSQLFVVGSQTANLIPDPSFGQNLCFEDPNGSCEPILDIYVPRAFPWYK
jgi:hypothetical protein